MARSPFLPPFPSDWALVVEAVVPEEGFDSYVDRIRLDRGPELAPQYFPGTAYRAAEPSETATHYPTVRNRRGGFGFVCVSRAEGGSVSSNRSR